MGLKILHSADWHLDTPFSSFPEEQRKCLQRELKKIPGRVGELIRREGPDLVLLSGDLLDGQGTRESIDLLKQAFRDYGIPVFISPGNHDFCGLGSPWTDESWPENVHIFTRGMESVTLPEHNCRIYGAGYGAMDCPPLLEGFRAEGRETYCIAVLHADPVNRNSPYCPISAAQVRESGLDYLALGHIHKAGFFQSGSTLCGWPGCPMGRGWDETGDKGVYIVTLGDTAKIRQVNLDMLRFHDLAVDIASESPEDRLPPGGSRDFYRITLEGYGNVDLASVKRALSRFPNLELRDETAPPIDLWEDADSDTLRGMYFRLLKQSGDPRAKLAAELSQRLLAGREVDLP